MDPLDHLIHLVYPHSCVAHICYQLGTSATNWAASERFEIEIIRGLFLTYCVITIGISSNMKSLYRGSPMLHPEKIAPLIARILSKEALYFRCILLQTLEEMMDFSV